MRLVQIPTTLLAMVDSSVGGKTGINHKLGKNLIGSFYQPDLVVVNPLWLHTLGYREMLEGLAEIIKAGLLSSKRFFNKAVSAAGHLPRIDPDAIIPLIADAIRFKARVVAADTYDLGGRMILNFGHTFGHAIELAEGYGRFRHGEAVLAGMIGALHLSKATGRLAATEFDACMEKIGPLVSQLPPMRRTISDYVKPIAVDKKSKGGRSRFVLLEAIGRPVVCEVRSRSAIRASVTFMRNVVNNRGTV
jgi:3-dehydroquinate synthase